MKRTGGSGGLDLDSLMDILSCLVGVMLFLVIYTVLELGSVAYQAVVPLTRAAPTDARRVVVLCEAGTVRVLDTDAALGQLLSGFEIVRTFDEVPVFVEGNQRTPTDAFFQYSLEYQERMSIDLLGTLDLRVVERSGAMGDSIHQLDAGSPYADFLRRVSPRDAWLTFAVDSASVDVFRRARDMAVSLGFATGWDQVRVDFPLTYSLSGDAEDWLSQRTTLSKPQR
jgi:hypothetical protein